MTSVAPIRRDVVTLAGPDTAPYLQGQLSQDVAALSKGESALSFVLQPQGKVDGWLRVVRTGDDAFRLDTDAGAGEALVARLERFKLRTKTEITLTAGVEVLAVRGAAVPGATPCLWPGVEGADVFPDDAATPPAGAEELDAGGYEALRIAAGIPRAGAEITTDTIPAELGQWVIDASVSFTKGCYTGQELVARIDSRGGNVPRHLRAVEAEADLAPGAAVVVGGEEVGVVTSAAGRRGLALVHRKVEPPAAAEVAGAPARVRALPSGG
jgi:folate-binding protein YgfZ